MGDEGGQRGRKKKSRAEQRRRARDMGERWGQRNKKKRSGRQPEMKGKRGKEEEVIEFEWKIRWRRKRGSGGDERRGKRGRAAGSGALSDAGRDHLDESRARSLTVNTGLHFHMEKDQGKRFKQPLSTFWPSSTQKPRLHQPSCPCVGGKRYPTSLLAVSFINISLPDLPFFYNTHLELILKYWCLLYIKSLTCFRNMNAVKLSGHLGPFCCFPEVRKC